MGASGHMFNQHYMDPMFPLNIKRNSSDFLDSVVEVDQKLASRRESEAVHQIGAMRQDSFRAGEALEDEAFDTAVSPRTGSNDNATFRRRLLSSQRQMTNGERDGEVSNKERMMAVMNDVEIAAATTMRLGIDAKGKTVKQLSRLWNYMGGGCPPQ